MSSNVPKPENFNETNVETSLKLDPENSNLIYPGSTVTYKCLIGFFQYSKYISINIIFYQFLNYKYIIRNL